MKMEYLKINAALISALTKRWRSDTHMFIITLQDVSILLGLRVDGVRRDHFKMDFEFLLHLLVKQNKIQVNITIILIYH